jgi:voltage-gated potassium channel
MTVSPADLVAVPLFDSLNEQELQELAHRFEAKDVGEGIRLVGEGASGYSFFILADGIATVTAGGDEVAQLGPGDFFGEMALLGDGRRRATVTTSSPAKVLVLFGTEFRQLEQDHPHIAEQIETAMRDRAALLG